MEGGGVFFVDMIRLSVRGKNVSRKRSQKPEEGQNITPSRKEHKDNLTLNALMACSCLNAVFSQLDTDRI